MSEFFKGIFDTDTAVNISVTDFLICLGCSLVLGLIMAFAYMHKSRYNNHLRWICWFIQIKKSSC